MRTPTNISSTIHRIESLLAVDYSRPPRDEWKFDDADESAIYCDIPIELAGKNAISILFNADWGTSEDREVICLLRNNAPELMRLAKVGLEAERSSK